jgi:hypothetical protein
MPERMNRRPAPLLAAAALALTIALPGVALAQSGKIVCWKDKAGKVVGCGDKIPPEYLGSATKELDSHGVTRKQTESAEELARRRALERERAATATTTKTEVDRKSIDQQRQDNALLATYANEQEIDLKRDRDLQVLDLQIEQLTGALKNTAQRHDELKARAAIVEKNKKPLPAALKDDLTRVSQEKERFERSVESKKKEKEALRLKYAEYRKRYTELRAGQTSATR